MSQNELAAAGANFARLLVLHDRELFHYIMAFIPRRADAEEILQRTAIVLWQKFSEYDASRDFLHWALRIAYFEVLNFRKEVARSRLIFEVDVLEKLAETRQTLREPLNAQQEALQECLKKVGDESASLLRRHYCDAEAISALAAEKGKTRKALYRKLDRIRDLIADCVERRSGPVRTAQ